MADCQTFTAPRHEGAAHHIARVVHNLFYPHHPHHRVEAPVAFGLIEAHVCVAPELETITVSSVTPEDPPDAPEGHHGSGFGADYAPGAFGGSTLGAASHGPVHAPELDGSGWTGALLLLAGLLAVIRGKRT